MLFVVLLVKEILDVGSQYSNPISHRYKCEKLNKLQGHTKLIITVLVKIL